MKGLHHANIYLGDCRKEVYKILEEDLGLKIVGSPDFFFREGESFGIDDARALEKWAISKPFVGDKKVAYIIANALNWEAQNALLKVLEEPTYGTYFFIQLPNLSGVLPTFLSRVRVYDERRSEEATEGGRVAKDFLLSSIKARFSTVHSLSKGEDKGAMKDLIRSLENIAYSEYAKGGAINKEESEKMRRILTAKTFASLKGGSPKMVLEWLSCVL